MRCSSSKIPMVTLLFYKSFHSLILEYMLYFKKHDAKEKHKGFADFYNLQSKEFQDRVKIISMEEFIKREGGEDGQFTIDDDMRDDVMATAKECDRRKKSTLLRLLLYFLLLCVLSFNRSAVTCACEMKSLM